jgi:hypothetical protein
VATYQTLAVSFLVSVSPAFSAAEASCRKEHSGGAFLVCQVVAVSTAICRDTAVAVMAIRQLGMNESALYPSAKVA